MLSGEKVEGEEQRGKEPIMGCVVRRVGTLRKYRRPCCIKGN
jgi:hypothetical protein